ncbi:hypothetical protein Baya_14348 [Bagarius yarrelli]|uniref:Uncharacterized protein n=1 Tax=Bagarius yarrelli TaxID=175774 RepID=A0A556V9A0_BAGYA|nr:hypothetical protein Baya_14348 [Bagarius yarrelli]
MEELQRLESHLEECYTVNTALLPEFCPRLVSFVDASPDRSAASEFLIKQPVAMHGPTNLKYQIQSTPAVNLQHVGSTGLLHCRSMEVGWKIVKHLWEPLNCTVTTEKSFDPGICLETMSMSMGLGQKIRKSLWKPLICTSVMDQKLKSHAHQFSTTTWQSFVPEIPVDINLVTVPMSNKPQTSAVHAACEGIAVT